MVSTCDAHKLRVMVSQHGDNIMLSASGLIVLLLSPLRFG